MRSASGSRPRPSRRSRPWRSTAGVLDLDRVRASYDAKAPADRRLHYDVQARLREGVWNCPKLPFPVNDLSAAFDVEDGLLTIHRAEGYNGVTTLRAGGRCGWATPAGSRWTCTSR